MSVDGFFNQTLTIKKAGALNSFGSVATGSSVTEAARIQRTRRLTIGEGGRQSEIRAVIYVSDGANIARQDLVTVDGEDMHVLSVQPAVHGDGFTHHLKVLAGVLTA